MRAGSVSPELLQPGAVSPEDGSLHPQFVGEGVPELPAAPGLVVASDGRELPGTWDGRAGTAFAGG